MSGRFAGQHVLVVGAGIAGAGAARALTAEGARVRVTDERPEIELVEAAAIRETGAELLAGGHEPGHLDGMALVVVSPGVPADSPVVRWAEDLGIPLWGELELGARLAEVPYIGITGTNGKTTATGMVTACLRAAGIDAVACGNIGFPFPLAATAGYEALVVECSSFQLERQTSFRPRVSALLNLAPDHLDRHRTIEGYAAAKALVFAGQRAGDTHVGNRDDSAAAAVSSRAPCPIVWFRGSRPEPGEIGYDGSTLVSRVHGPAEAIATVEGGGPGTREDAAAAAAISGSFGVASDAIRLGLASYTPPPHRGEQVAEVDGVRFLDNSKATNVHAALVAISAVERAVLIAGGVAKGVDLSPLRSAADRLVAVVALGEASDQIAKVFEGVVPVRPVGSVEEAVVLSASLAPRPGVVLLAPACASWDMFRDYEERGDRFAAAVRGLEGADGRA